MRRVSLSLAMISFCGFSTLLYGGVVLSENFDAAGVSLGVTSAGAFSTINGTNVDIVGPGLFGSLCASPESGNCVDMDGTGGNPQGQLQSNMLFPAGNYLLSFDLIGSQRGNTAATTVTFGNYDHTFTLASADVTDGIVVSQAVTLSAPGHLLFVADQGGDVGNLLDNVVVSTTTTTSGVPEPSTLPLIGLALLAGIMVLRRRRASVMDATL